MQDAKAAPNARLTANKSTVDWPYWDDAEAQGLLDALNSGKWGRPGGGKWVAQFESAFGAAMQARYCLATASGTTALLTSLGALNIGPGDEVLLPPYTFVATFNAITHSFALPVFVDSDPETFQIDASKIAAKINDQTKTIIPVHIGGSVADMDAVLSAAQARKIPVIEDACQAPLAQWRNRPVGTWGLGGCLSFQTSKNISSGEGGAVLTNDEEFFNRCFNFHTPGGGKSVESLGRGSNYRLTEFQAATLLVQLSRAESHAKTRDENATYLNQMFAEIPGIQPAKLTAGCTRSAWHLYMWRYDPKQFANLSRAGFLKELAKEGIPASSGYTPLNSSAHVRALANNPHYLRIYGKATMEQWAQRNACPVNDRLCEEAVWFTQDKLLGTKADMERYAKAISNIQMRAPSLTKT
jgi:dTDP-4-amino-4,6-dideoxygalactose transaminase